MKDVSNCTLTQPGTELARKLWEDK